MSSTGHGGLSQIQLTLAAAGTAGSKYTFTHNVGRALQTSSVVDGVGNVIQGVSVLQSSLNACVIQNLTSSSRSVTVMLQWEEGTPKLDVVKSTDTRLASGTASTTPTIYVATTGSDSVGDGTQSKPFATIQRALDTLPDDLPSTVIQLGAGTFTAPKRFPRCINLCIYGDRSAPIINAAGATFSLKTGSSAKYEATVPAFTDTITDGSHWLDTDAVGSAVALLASSTPKIMAPWNSTSVVWGNPTYVYAFTTTISVPDDPVNYFYTQADIPFGVAYIGVKFAATTTAVLRVSGEGSCFAISFMVGDSLEVACRTFYGITDSDVVAYGSPDGTCSISGAFAYITGLCYQVNIIGAVITMDSTFTPVTAMPNTYLTLSGVDIGGAGTVVAIYQYPGSLMNVGVVRLTTTARTRFLTCDGARFTCTGGSASINGQTNGVCVVMTNGAHITGIETAASTKLTNGAVAGNEITVGGNSVNTFASLPATDLAAGAPQLCRAT